MDGSNLCNKVLHICNMCQQISGQGSRFFFLSFKFKNLCNALLTFAMATPDAIAFVKCYLFDMILYNSLLYIRSRIAQFDSLSVIESNGSLLLMLNKFIIYVLSHAILTRKFANLYF